MPKTTQSAAGGRKEPNLLTRTGLHVLGNAGYTKKRINEETSERNGARTFARLRGNANGEGTGSPEPNDEAPCRRRWLSPPVAKTKHKKKEQSTRIRDK
jgi:hypothetical protein